MTCACVFITHTRGFHPDFFSELNLLIHEPEDASFRAWTHGLSSSCRNARWEGCHRGESNSSVVVNQVFRNWDRRKKEKNRTWTKIDKKVILLKFKGNQKRYEPDTESDILHSIGSKSSEPIPARIKKSLTRRGIGLIIRKRQTLFKRADKNKDSWEGLAAEYEPTSQCHDQRQCQRVRAGLKRPQKR